MHVQPSQAISIVRDQVDATGLPAASTHTATLWKNGATTAVSVTRTNPDTGVYKFAWTIPADAAENDVFSLRVVDGDGYASTVWEGVVGVTSVLDSAVRVKLDATQPDYAPLKASDYTAPANSDITLIKAKTDNLPADPADQSAVEAAITAATSPLATPAQVNAQVVDALSVDTYAELTAPPAATSSLKDKITWLFMYARNKVTQTATQRKLYRDDGSTVAGTSGTTDDGTTFTKGEDA